MRVIAGTAGGRRLVAPEGPTTRPTTDRVREATFNALGSLGVVVDATVLDLFAGSGAMGIEALSRGASHVTFVDQDRGARSAVEANLAAFAMAGQARIVATSAERHLADAAHRGDTYDLAFVDPPYGFDAWDELLTAIPAEVVVVESGAPLVTPVGFEELRTKRYGRSHVTILERVVPS